MYIYIYICICMCVYIYIYIFIYRTREIQVRISNSGGLQDGRGARGEVAEVERGRVEGGFALDFELPSGAYATTLLRELYVEVVAATGVEEGSSSSS